MPAKKAKPRQTQAERRDATRGRILDATLHCLAHRGYAGTGVAQVCARARVSRGAWAHHFASMDALILEAAQHLMTRVYQRLGAVLQQLPAAGDGVDGLVRTAWQEFFASDVNEIYLELLIAARRDRKLAEKLAGLSRTLERNLNAAGAASFDAQPRAASSVAELMHLNRWVLRGLALDAPLLPPAAIARALDAWSRLAASQMASRLPAGNRTVRQASA